MRRMSLAKLLALIAALAVGLAAVRVGSEPWFRGMYALTLSALAIALLGAVLETPPKGAWHGFALFGASYFLLTFVPALHDAIGRHLPDSGLLDGVARRLHQRPVAPASAARVARIFADEPGDFLSFTPVPPRKGQPPEVPPEIDNWIFYSDVYANRVHYS